MADLWIPGWGKYLFGLRGKPYQFTHNPKGCLHSTEGSSIAGALAAYAPYPPHGIYDCRTRERLQHIPLNLASYSAMDGNDDDYMVQIELVGFAAAMRDLPEQALRNIAEDVVKPLEDVFGIPRTVIWHGFKDARDGISPALASTASPIRLTWSQLRDFSGWLGHQHLPSPDEHWDPGALPMQKILSYLEDDMSELAEQRIGYINDALGGAYDPATGATAGTRLKGIDEAIGDAYEFDGKTRKSLGTRVKAIEAAVQKLATSGVPVDVRLSDEDVTRIATKFVDLVDARARDNNPNTGPVS